MACIIKDCFVETGPEHEGNEWVERIQKWVEAHPEFKAEAAQVMWNAFYPEDLPFQPAEIFHDTARKDAIAGKAVKLKYRSDPIRWPDDDQGWFEPDIWDRFDRAMQSGNQFVIITGPPGTGKTWLPIIYAAVTYECLMPQKDKEIMRGRLETEGVLKIIPCRPNWTSPRPLVGGKDFKGKWSQGLLEEFIHHACENEGKKHFLVIDEMNLSHPEHYLSDFISSMETGVDIRKEKDREDEKGKSLAWPPGNLAIIGTVNVDETTQTLSPRLKSRAWVLELRTRWDRIIERENGKRRRIAEMLGNLDKALQETGFGFGIRDLEHIDQYTKKASKEFESLMWEAISQKLLPKLRGTKDQLKPSLTSIKALLPEGELKEKINTMLEKLENEEYLAGC